jgi:ABC-type phosphate transport system substrate-binding protein
MSVFERKVFEGGNMWNDSVKEYQLMLKADGTRTVPSAERVKRVGMDADAITFSSEGFGTGQTKALPLAATEGGPFVPLTLENVRNRSYPLTLELYAYADQQPDKPMEPTTKEFLRFILSREGQDILQRDGKWLPLTAEMVKEQRAKLDRVIPAYSKPGKRKDAAGGGQ